MTGGDREGQSVEAREECEDAGPGTSIGRRGAAVDDRGGRCSLFLTMRCFSRCDVFQFLTMSFLGDV